MVVGGGGGSLVTASLPIFLVFLRLYFVVFGAIFLSVLYLTLTNGIHVVNISHFWAAGDLNVNYSR